LLSKEQQDWVQLVAPESLLLAGPKPTKLLYAEDGTPTAAIKLHEALSLAAHPLIGEGKVKVVFQLQTPDMKKFAVTDDMEKFRRTEYQKQRSALQKKFPSIAWP
jgi:ATP-dependent helicase HrpB